MSVRPVPLAVGVLALLAGTALALGIGPEPSSTVGTVAFVIVVLIGAVVAAFVALGRAAEGPRSDPLPEPGRGGDGRVAGAAVDERLAELASADDAERERLVERVERAAVATLTSADDRSAAEVRRQLSTGEWTADERAAAFLADDAPAPSIGDRLRTVVTGTSTSQRRAAHAIAELHRQAEDE